MISGIKKIIQMGMRCGKSHLKFISFVGVTTLGLFAFAVLGVGTPMVMLPLCSALVLAFYAAARSGLREAPKPLPERIQPAVATAYTCLVTPLIFTLWSSSITGAV